MKSEKIRREARSRIPQGYSRVESGPLAKGDMVWNTNGHWDPVTCDGTVSAEQCWFVVRRNK